MIIETAYYTASYPSESKSPRSKLPEYAFIGRSNVGKSSLINMLCDRKGLAKVSGTPGKTQYLNFFLINNSWHIVDLPGYGYAPISKTKRREWEKMIRGYLSKRETLCGVVIFVDIRRTEQVDKDLVNWLQGLHLPQVIVLTKADKLGSGKRKEALRRTRQELSLSPETELLLYSAHTHEGRLDVMHALKNLLMART